MSTLPLASADALEPYEGMLVRFAQELTVTEHFQLGRFGEVLVSSGGRLRQPTSIYPAADPQSAALQAANDLNQLIVDDALNNQNADPIVVRTQRKPALSASNTLRGGDTLTNPVGVMTYGWAGNAASRTPTGCARSTPCTAPPTSLPRTSDRSRRPASVAAYR